jgi:hypothetical protein
MIYIDFMPMPGKKNSKNFSDSVVDARNHSRAYRALHDMIAFHETLEEEMQAMLSAAAHGTPMDKELFSKMVTAKESYLVAMQGLKNYDDQQEHLALIIYADAVQDVIRHINQQKRH